MDVAAEETKATRTIVYVCRFAHVQEIIKKKLFCQIIAWLRPSADKTCKPVSTEYA